MNPGCTPQRVAATIHSMKSRISTAEPRTCGTVRAASGRPCRLGRKPGSAPASPQQGQPHPEQSVEASQCGSLPFSLEGNELNAESSVLHRDGAMTTEEESQQTKQRQDEGRHEPRYLVFPALKVKSLPTDRLLASHNAAPRPNRRHGPPSSRPRPISCSPLRTGRSCPRANAGDELGPSGPAGTHLDVSPSRWLSARAERYLGRRERSPVSPASGMQRLSRHGKFWGRKPAVLRMLREAPQAPPPHGSGP
jgi:hypothetical protein